MSDERRKRLLLAIVMDELSNDTSVPMAVFGTMPNIIHSTLPVALATSPVTDDNIRIRLYVECVVPLYSDDTFKSHFRMTRATFEVRSVAFCDC